MRHGGSARRQDQNRRGVVVLVGQPTSHALYSSRCPVAVHLLPDLALHLVEPFGPLLTKASELEGALSCRLADGRVFPASIQKVSQEHDLALLKINTAGLPEARWSSGDSIAPGTLIAALVPGQPAPIEL